MSLKRKLARLQGTSVHRVQPETNLEAPDERVAPTPERQAHDESQPGEQDERQQKLRRHLGLFSQTVSSRQHRLAAPTPTATVPGEVEPTEHGSLRKIMSEFPPEHIHGVVRVSHMLKLNPQNVAQLALNPDFAELDLQNALFLDTETTGLGGGTGVLPFLIGLAWFEGQTLKVEQLLLEEVGEEAAMIARVQERVEKASCIISYNGKTYDWPLVSTRAVMNRMPAMISRPHLDLLHCARRVYKPRLGQVRLVDMEEQVLGMHRHGDISGADIPSVFWNFLQEGETEPLHRVIHHNLNDVVSLAAILTVLVERYADLHQEEDPRDQLARAKVGLRSGDVERAKIFAQVAVTSGASFPEVIHEASLLLAKLHVRNKDYSAAEKTLYRGLELLPDGLFASELHLELAKLYEHRFKYLHDALRQAKKTDLAEGIPAQQKRMTRLERKIVQAGTKSLGMF